MIITKIQVILVSVEGLAGWGFGLSGPVEGILDHGKGLEQDILKVKPKQLHGLVVLALLLYMEILRLLGKCNVYSWMLSNYFSLCSCKFFIFTSEMVTLKKMY